MDAEGMLKFIFKLVATLSLSTQYCGMKIASKREVGSLKKERK